MLRAASYGNSIIHKQLEHHYSLACGTNSILTLVACHFCPQRIINILTSPSPLLKFAFNDLESAWCPHLALFMEL